MTGHFPRMVLVATGNAGKREELATLLRSVGVQPCFEPLPSPDEDGETYAKNALLKARAAWLATGHAALADDVGLEVEALGGEPGLHTRRWAEGQGGFAKAAAHLCVTCPGSPAVFHCALALVTPHGQWTGVAAVPGQVREVSVPGPGLEGAFQPNDAGAHHRQQAWLALSLGLARAPGA